MRGFAGKIARAAAFLAAGVAVAGGLAACGTDGVAVATGTDLSAAGAQAVSQAKAYVSDMQQRRLTANIDLVASDPSCVWGTAIIISPTPTPAQLEAAARTRAPLPSLCEPAPGGVGSFRYDLRPISGEQIKPTLTLISAIADYVSAMDKILSENAPDISKQLGDIKAKADDVKDVVNGLSGANIADPLSADQLKAADGLIDIAAKLYEESKKGRALRKLTGEDDKKVRDVIESLKGQVAQWQRDSVDADNQVTVLALERAQRQVSASLDFPTRRAFIQQIAVAQTDIGVSKRAATGLVSALSTIEEKQTHLQQVLQGQLTEDEKRQAAQADRDTLFSVISALAGLFKAFP